MLCLFFQLSCLVYHRNIHNLSFFGIVETVNKNCCHRIPLSFLCEPRVHFFLVLLDYKKINSRQFERISLCYQLRFWFFFSYNFYANLSHYMKIKCSQTAPHFPIQNSMQIHKLLKNLIWMKEKKIIEVSNNFEFLSRFLIG